MTLALLLAPSLVALISGVRLARAPDLDPDDDPFGDEQYWVGLFRTHGHIAAALGAAGVALAIAAGLGEVP